jgi:hypothetical protein
MRRRAAPEVGGRHALRHRTPILAGAEPTAFDDDRGHFSPYLGFLSFT